MRTAEDFARVLSSLIVAELPRTRRDPDRLALMIERLVDALALAISVGSGGDKARAEVLLEGARSYLDELVARGLPLGRLLSQ